MATRIGRFLPGLAALFLFLLITGCGGDDDPTDPGGGGTPADTTPPARVMNLFPGHVTGTTVTLSWTAPGDDGNTGTAAEYDLRWSGVAITDATWGACNRADGEPTPGTAGVNQVATVDVGMAGTYHFALKTADEVPNWSELSNSTMAEVTGEGFTIHQLTTVGHNTEPNLDDGVVVWVAKDAAGDEIWIANISNAFPSPSRLTDNGGEKARPNNHGSERIVWEGQAHNMDDWEIWLYDKYTIPRFRAFTDNDVPDHHPDLTGTGNFAWLQGGTMFEAVHYWNEGMHDESIISNDCCPTSGWSNGIPAAGDGAVVWRSYDRVGSEGHRINQWDGTLTNLSDTLDASLSVAFSVDASGIAYQYGTGTPAIRFWDGSTFVDAGSGYNPSLYDGTIAFEKWDGMDWEIYYWDGTTTHRITDNTINDTHVSLYGTLIAWAGAPSGGMSQIYYVNVE